MSAIRLGIHHDRSELYVCDPGTVQLARIAAARLERQQRQFHRDLWLFRIMVIGTTIALGATIYMVAEYGVADDSIRPTRYPRLGYRCDGRALWRIYDRETDSAVGPHYASKAELLGDLARYAVMFGVDAGTPGETVAPWKF